jgi:hypothetical protein
MNKRVSAIIKSIIKDMASKDKEVVSDVTITMNHSVVIQLFLEAGCPQSILFAIRDSLPLSYLERKYCATKILAELNRRLT